MRIGTHTPCRGPRRVALLFLALLLPLGCGGGGGGGSAVGAVGQELTKPGGGLFFVDPNVSGGSTRLHLAEMFWARLVDVHDQDAHGQPSPAPLYRDFPIGESVQTDAFDYLLVTNPITQRTRLIVRRTRGAPDAGNGTFTELLRRAALGLAPVLPKHDDGSAGEPFSFVARNAALVLRFDDLLDDDEDALRVLPETVRLLSGYPPVVPFGARIFFDPNHGGIAADAFHSTRVIVDCSVSETEAASFPIPLELNSDGLPASLALTGQPNTSIRIPTRLSPGTGQFTLLRGLSGTPLRENENGPVDLGTHEIVRAMRSGNSGDTNNGFLLDLNAPAIVSGWQIVVEGALPDPDGLPGIDWRVDLRFTTPCKGAPEVGDICSVGQNFLEVLVAGPPPDAQDRVLDVRVRVLQDEPVGSASVLLGTGELLTRFDDQKPVDTGCWIAFSPPPQQLPQRGVAPEAQIVVRFTEPMDPNSINALESLLLVRGDVAVVPAADSIVIGAFGASADLRRFTLTPTLPLPTAGLGELYHLLFGTLTDLAGNHLVDAPVEITFSMDVAAEHQANGGLVVRFDEVEELGPTDGRDFRGQFFYDLTAGRVRPRPVAFQSVPADRTNPVPAIMIPFPSGVQTPLSPLGSKLQTLWRYCDLGWNVRDETKYNIDVVGLAWSPTAGQVISDFYQNFEIRLAHSRFLPDECITNNLLPKHLTSGLLGEPRLFTENILNDPLSPQKVVHERSLGYTFSQAIVFAGPSGTTFVPFPLNRGNGPLTSYTWRDTAVLAKAGPNGDGIPLCIEASRAIGLENAFGTIARSGEVPSFGLPLLMEFRCYPSNTGVGLNAIDISLAINSSALPAFRCYSTGGLNRNGTVIRVEPDLEDFPKGGWNPNSVPPGRRTARSNENAFYIGQLDYVTRVSRMHSAWIDTQDPSPDFLDPVLQPAPENQPLGTQVVFEYRGATGFNGTEVKPFDAQSHNAYGEPLDVDGALLVNVVRYMNNVRTWTNNINAVDGARYLQLRISFLSSIDSGLSPDLDAIGLPFTFD
ncbi:MAG: hypothetical protein EXS08_00010 [Planctomycetes bacterium]|nr:hypothetical protein [Planctomycetota bacterium]